MCGIVGYTGTQQAKGILIDGLQHLEYRGYDSAGIAVFNGKEIEVVRRQGKVAELVAALGADDCLGTCGIGHTRWATHGAPSERNAHPHTSCSNNIAVVHNGIIENFNELREDLVLKGHVFSSDTDTEVVAHLVEDFYRGDLLEAVQKATALLTGAYGIAVICTDEPGKMVITRKDSPIVVGCDSTGSYVASDIVALVRATRLTGVVERAQALAATKLGDSLLSVFVLAIFCNILIYIAVEGYRSIQHELGKYLAVFFGVTVFVVGHINKEGAIAGPKVLEHMVDCVLYFEGEEHTTYRLLRAAKNRFGSTNEIGVFEMDDRGLREVPNPSELLLAGRPLGTPGTCVACVMEGTRPVLAEVQALVCQTTYNMPRRTSNGYDYNRAAMLLAVLEKRGGLRFGSADVYLNVIGGLRLDEPAADLAIAIAVASAALDKPAPDTLAAIGEVGLTGEIRAVNQLNQRLSELHRLGFTRCLIPRSGTQSLHAPEGLELLRVRNIREAMAVAL